MAPSCVAVGHLLANRESVGRVYVWGPIYIVYNCCN